MAHLRHLIYATLLGLAGLVPGQASATDALTQAIWRGDIGTSLELVHARIEANPGDFEAHRIYIDLLSGIGYASTAVQEYKARAHASPESADAWALLGRAAPTAPASIGAYDKAIELNPKHSAALTGKAEVLRATGSTVRAIELYTEALEVETTRGETWTGLTQAWLARGSADTATILAQKATVAAPDDPSVWLLAATVSPDEAEALLKAGLKIHPDISQLWRALGRAHFDAQQWKKASDAYSEALKRDAPEAAFIRVEKSLVDEIRAGALNMTGAAVILDIRSVAEEDLSLALAALSTLAEEQPQSGQVRLVYGNILRAIGNHGEAENQLLAARDLMPDDAETWSALGSFYLDQRRPNEARPLLEQAARTRPKDPVLAVAAALAAADSGDTAGAEASLRSAMERFPTSVGPVLGLTRLLITHKRGEEALELLTSSLRTRPDADLALALASAAKELGQEEQAIVRLEKLAEETKDPRLAAAARGLRAAATHRLPEVSP